MVICKFLLHSPEEETLPVIYKGENKIYRDTHLSVPLVCDARNLNFLPPHGGNSVCLCARRWGCVMCYLVNLLW